MGCVKKQQKWLLPFLFVVYVATSCIILTSIHQEPIPEGEWLHPSIAANANIHHKVGKNPMSYYKDNKNNIGADNDNNDDELLESLSSVDYFACCGLGHRLIRMSLANYVARQRNFSLRAFWGWCGEENPIEVFSYLFRPYHRQEVAHVQSHDLILPFYNEVPGFNFLVRQPTTDVSTCPCQQDKIDSDFELYTSLSDRFRNRDRVEDYVTTHFTNKTVIGIHVRAGNGEVGDFERKGRGIDNPNEWVQHVVDMIHQFASQHHEMTQNKEIIIYVASDTPSMITLFRNKFKHVDISVLEAPSAGRREEGQGVLFGESDKVHNKRGSDDEQDDYTSCLDGWTDTLTDMFLLSRADVVIAGKPSSFSQTLPMSIAFGTERRTSYPPFCEMIPQFEQQSVNGSYVWQETLPKLQCYESYLDWCCNHSTWIKFRHVGPMGHVKIHSKEFIKFPQPNLIDKEVPKLRNRTMDCPRPKRGRAGGGIKDKCLPHKW